MATISTLAVNLIARTSVFERNMKRSRRTTRSLGTSLLNISKKVAMFGTAMISAGAVMTTMFIKKSLKSIDVTAKLSRRLGIATEELIALQHGAQINGVSLEAMNKSLDMFVRRIGELSTGSGEATRGLEMLNMKYEDLESLGPYDALKKVADKIRELPNASQKAAAAYFMFGRAGAQLVNLFQGGSATIEGFREEVEALGLTFSSGDALKVEEFNDSITRMQAIWTGFMQTMTIGMAKNAGDQMKVLSITGAGWNAFFSGILEGYANWIKQMNKYLKWNPAFQIVNLARKYLYGETYGEAASRIENEATKLWDEAGKALDKYVNKMGDIEKANRLKPSEPLGKILPDYEKMKSAADRLKESLKSPIEKLKDIRTGYKELLQANLITQEEFNKGLRNAASKLVDISGKTKLEAIKDVGLAEIIGKEINIGGIAGRAVNPALERADKQILLIEETNKLLAQINSKEGVA